MEEVTVLEMSLEELVQFLNYLREDVMVNVTIEGGDADERREEI